MEFKEGNQWKCGFDPKKGLYTAQIGFGVNCTLYEITKENAYEYFLDPQEMKYYLKPDHSGQGTAIRIENGVITEESENHLRVYERTGELD